MAKLDSVGRVFNKNAALKTIITATFVVFATFIIIEAEGVQAETLNLLSNTNKCVYNPENNRDFCKTEYELCDSALKIDKISFLYGDFTTKNELRNDEFKSEISGIDTEIKIEDEGLCYKVEISGYKLPYISVDNVLCFDKNCHYEYALWNETYSFRRAIYGNASVTSDVTAMIPKNWTINGSLELAWGEWVINATNRTIGYIYFNNETDYIYVNADESSAVPTIIDQGNSTRYGNPDPSLVLWLTMNGTDFYDQSLYHHPYSAVHGDPTKTSGKIGNSVQFDGVGDFVNYTADVINSAEGTLCMWTNAPNYATLYDALAGCQDDEFLFYYNTPSNVIYVDKTVLGVTSPTVDVWNYVCAVWNSTGVYAFKNGELTQSNAEGDGIADCTVFFIAAWLAGQDDRCINSNIDNVMLWNASHESDEITVLYETQKTFFGNFSTQINTTTTPINTSLGIIKTFCYDDSHLYKRVKDVADNGSAVFNEYLEYCEDGCSNETFLNFGKPGCIESNFELSMLIFVFAVVIFGLIIKVLKL